MKGSDDDPLLPVKPPVSVYRDKNTIFFYDELTPESIYYLEKYMRDIFETTRADRINIVLDSDGGSPCAIYDFIKAFPLPVYCYVKGYCCSAATMILLGGTRRFMSPSSLLLIHSFQGEGDEWEKEGSIRDNYNNVLRLNETFRNVYRTETKIPIKSIDALLSDRERYLTADECKKWGIIHAIAPYVGV